MIGGSTRMGGGDAVRTRFRREAARWDQIYSEPAGPVAAAWDRLTRRNVRQRFARTFAAVPDLAGRSVLDLGCGSGRYLVEAAARGARRVLGIDFSDEMVVTARRLAASSPGGDRVEVRCVDLRGVDLGGERFDLVIANGLFDYLGDAVPVLAAAARACRGLLVATFPDRFAPRALPRAVYWRMRGLRIHLYDRVEVEALARVAGLDGEVERIGPIFLLLARPRDRA